MVEQQPAAEGRVAVLVDCDNTTPEILEYALHAVAQFGRLVIRRGYGNHHTLANKWQEALVRLAFTPCLQFQYAPGKNTSDLALALDALEAMFDARADTFCLVTSDSDFAYLCRKLRERGATVSIVGEAKTPDALRNASDHFFEWQPAEVSDESAPNGKPTSADTTKKRAPRKRPKAVISAVALLGNETPDGWVGLGAIGQYLKRTDPSFSSKAFGYAALSDLIRAYPELTMKQESGSGLWVTLKAAGERTSTAQVRE
ncbi:NYN domain-containing protein [Ralstonia pseudosolanacearum CaRs-Mep]|nr:NYN domain-containing protein [Ralstonia pseudosolanacearum]MCL1622600.1 NYN domain-containing protein [Ralstonia pseudosolanacearum CaRs-Mep]